MVERDDVAEQFKEISDCGVHHGRGLRAGVSSRHFSQCLVRQTYQLPDRRAAAYKFDTVSLS